MLLQDLGVEVFRIRREHQTRRPGADRADLLAALSGIEETARSNDFDPVLPIVTALQSSILQAISRPKEAAETARRGLQAVRQPRQRDQAIALYVAYAEALAALGEWTEVAAVCREAIALVERRRARVSPMALASAYMVFSVRLYELAVHAAAIAGDLETALSIAELVKSRTLTNLRRASSHDATDTGALQAEFRALGRAIDAADEVGEDASALRAKRNALWDLITIDRLRARQVAGADFSVAAVQRTLSADEAAIFYFWVSDTSLLIAAIDRDHWQMRVETLSAADREGLVGLGRAILAFDNQAVTDSIVPPASLAACLLPAWLRQVVDDKHRLLICPHRVLHALPFHALAIDGRFLIERYAVTYVPNLTSLLWSFPAVTKGKALLVAAPRHDGPAGSALPYIPDAVHEIDDVAALYAEAAIPVQKLADAAATEAALQSLADSGSLATFTILHFACHGQNIDESMPMEARLYLRDSALDGLDIANWSLRADVLVLSACASGQRPIGGRDFVELPGDDLFGLQAAFFMAGVRQILSTLWPVQSWAARQIAVLFHRHLQRLPAELALQEAQKAFIARGPLSAHPAVWGPFFLVRAASARSTE
jgi:hypothetical protein